ncbi:MAG: hypothetical protein JWM68_994 [Verrucomicrobiales bacterium]|nr:hypothetical protein [Verrucomicrobiales bacterium]
MNTGVNYQVSTRLGGTAASGVSYLQTATTRSPSSYSILSNKINVTATGGAGRFTFTSDGSNPFDLQPALGTSEATPTDPVIYELAVKIANKSPGTERTSFGLAPVDGGIQDWDLGIQLVNSNANLYIYRRVDGGSNPSGADYNNIIATLIDAAGDEIDLRLRITDAGAESGAGNFNSRYEVFVNNSLLFTSATNDFRFEGSAARLVLFDTAGGAGPVTYDAFSLTVSPPPAPPVLTNHPFKITSQQLVPPSGLQLAWNSLPGTNYSVLRSTELGSPAWLLAANLTAATTSTAVTATINRTAANYFAVAQLAHSGLALTNVIAVPRTGTSLVDIYFNLSDVYGGAASISVLISTDGGQTYHAAAASFSGDVGDGVNPGTGLHIVWDAGADWSVLAAATVRIKIVADRSLIGPDLALIPAGAFSMGDSKGEGLSCELPTHTVNVSAFYLGRHEVTKALWDDVTQWATNHGYTFDNAGVAAAANLPIQQVSWHDAVKWCNARSEKESFPPAYFVDKAWTSVYRTGQVNLKEANVRWNGAGYRLPTEAEWEKAARGGLVGKRFPFGDTITQVEANYWSTSFESFDVNNAPGPHPQALAYPNVLPTGSFRPSGYGVYDMAGNTWEWCWDLYGDAWYSDARSSSDNTRGPSSASWGGDRVYRGGSGVDIAWKSRVANRADAPPRFAMGHFGFRVALPAGNDLVAAESATFSLTP